VVGKEEARRPVLNLRKQGVKKQNPIRRAGKLATVFRQVCELIPSHLVPKLARECGVDVHARSFKPWSHVVALIYAQLSYALSLNDVCDALRMFATPLRAIRGATPPSRNALSHANKVRDCQMAERLFWTVLEHLQASFRSFGGGPLPRTVHRFRREIHVVDSTVIRLVMSCLDWAKHRRRKAGVKCHLRMSLRSLLPACAVIDCASEHDSVQAFRVCAGLHEGEIVIFDKAYLHFALLHDLNERGVFFVTRAREDQAYEACKRLPKGADCRVVSDEIINLSVARSAKQYPETLRRVVAVVEIKGEQRELVFLTNNFTWSAGTIADLYRCRWQIETFFKQIKQSLQLADFLGHNANAVHWQIWTALLVHLLLRFLAWRSRWHHAFSRLFTATRAALWLPKQLDRWLRSYGTAAGDFAAQHPPIQRVLPGF